MSKEYAIKFVDATQQCISWGDLYNIMNETANETTAIIADWKFYIYLILSGEHENAQYQR